MMMVHEKLTLQSCKRSHSCRLTDRCGHEDERKDKEGKMKYLNPYL